MVKMGRLSIGMEFAGKVGASEGLTQAIHQTENSNPSFML
jgi:hypothetical protein